MDWISERCGPHAWLVRFGDSLSPETMSRALAVSRDLELRPPRGLREFTMGYASVLLEFEELAGEVFSPGDSEVHGLLQKWRSMPAGDVPARRLEIPVVYDGVDLDEVARRTGLDAREVIERHCSRDYHVWLLGFSPGFPYLGILDDSLQLPRRKTPRPRIAAGSVAIAGMQTGIYPGESAGGWHIIGRTMCRIFDPRSAEPFLLKPGDTVRFTAVEAEDG